MAKPAKKQEDNPNKTSVGHTPYCFTMKAIKKRAKKEQERRGR